MPSLTSTPTNPVQTLLAGAIDYAGLFPPAALSMLDAVVGYAGYGRSAEAWALGRFIVSAGRLDEFGSAVAAVPSEVRGRGIWRASAVLAPGLDEDWRRVERFNAAVDHPGARVDSVETRAATTADVDRLLELIPASVERYVEVPLGPDLIPMLYAVKAGGGYAKIRMGGVTADAFPPVEAVVAFLEATHRLDLPFKATAGLHHPVRGRYRLTYEPAAPLGDMYGYLNLFLAAGLVALGAPAVEVKAALLDDGPGLIVRTRNGLRWRTREIDRAGLARLRAALHGFGSCSFREPIDELTQAGLA